MPLVLLALGLSSCESNWLPKPPGYNRIDLPRHEYNSLKEGYPYSFDFSTHSTVEADSFNLEETEWINLNYKEFGAKVHMTYKKIDQSTDFKTLSYRKAPDQGLRDRRGNFTHSKWLFCGSSRTHRGSSYPISIFCDRLHLPFSSRSSLFQHCAQK